MELPEVVFDLLDVAVFAVFGLGGLWYAFFAMRVVVDVDYRLDTAAKLMDPGRSRKVPIIFQQNFGRWRSRGLQHDDEDVRTWEWGSREDIAVALLDRAQLYLLCVALILVAALAFLVIQPGGEPSDTGATSKTTGVEIYPADHPCVREFLAGQTALANPHRDQRTPSLAPCTIPGTRIPAR